MITKMWHQLLPSAFKDVRETEPFSIFLKNIAP